MAGPNHARMSANRFMALVLLGALGFNLVLVALAGYSLARSRRQYVDQAAVTAQNLAQVLEQNISGTIRKVDVGISALAHDAERQFTEKGLDPKRLGTYAVLARTALPELDGFRVADERGNLILGARSGAEGTLNIADRAYFTQLRDHPNEQLVVSRPLQGRIGNRWVIILARRINHPDGSFGGVAFGALPLERIDRLFSSIHVGKHGAFALRDGSDLALVARYPEPEGIGSGVGHKKMSPEFLDLVAQGQSGGAYDAPSGLDQRVRTWGYRKFDDGLYYIFVGLAKDEYLADWRRSAMNMGGALVGLLLVSALVATQLIRGWRRNRATEESLKANDERMRLFFERQIVGMAISNPDRHWVEVNDKWCEITGYDRADLAGIRWADLIPPEDQPESQALYEQLASGRIEAFTLTQCLIRKDGAQILVDQSVGCVRNPDGSLNYLLVLMEDVTEHRRSEEERLRLEHQLQNAQKLESLGSLAGGVAHDMNNVLAAILGLATANLPHAEEGSQAQQAFETIAKAAERGGQMVKSLLSLARQSPTEEAVLDLNILLQEEVQLLARTTLSRIQLRLDLAEGLWPIRGDASALTNAFMNLCVNAVDAMPEGGTLAIRSRNLEPGQVEVTLEDSGSGMPKEVLAKALDPFFTTKDLGKGTGLGLSLVYSTVKAHRGQLDLHSVPGEGTRITLRFPRCHAEATVSEAKGDLLLEHLPGVLRVLLVDDDELVQNSTQAMLEMLGHGVSPVFGGEEALARVEEGLRPDLIVLDMNMPGLSGAETLVRLRQMLPTTPVLLATGRVDQAALDLLEAHANVRLLAKPYGLRDLRQGLAEAIRP